MHFISRGDCINYFIYLVEIYHWQKHELMTIVLRVDVIVMSKITEEIMFVQQCYYLKIMVLFFDLLLFIRLFIGTKKVNNYN